MEEGMSQTSQGEQVQGVPIDETSDLQQQAIQDQVSDIQRQFHQFGNSFDSLSKVLQQQSPFGQQQHSLGQMPSAFGQQQLPLSQLLSPFVQQQSVFKGRVPPFAQQQPFNTQPAAPMNALPPQQPMWNFASGENYAIQQLARKQADESAVKQIN